ncbi:MAG: HAMP domain-containing protein [Rhodoferax sp.]|nr:HAMP domain-containing protein [Rhodoferax sp.]
MGRGLCVCSRRSRVSQTLLPDFEDTAEPADDAENGARKRLAWAGLSLFWRTFFMLALLLLGSILAWLQTLRAFEFEPRAIQTARQIASQVNLSRAALINADAIARLTLLKTMAQEEGLRIIPREDTDVVVSVDGDAYAQDMARELRQRLGAQTVVARRVNGAGGLWISFEMDGDPYWFLTDLERFNPAAGKTWVIWLMVATGLSLMGAALMAGRVNRPLRALSFAASRVRDGDFQASHLDETVHTREIREVNRGFNRMAQRLAKLDQDRALMLAGISHDLRTPLARLRLEAELSVADLDARAHMAADIAQLDAIIDKFLDYARPDRVALIAVPVKDIVQNCAYPFADLPDARITLQIDDGLQVLADEVELGRILSNLLENARKYGKSTDTGIARIDVWAAARDKWVYIKVRDHGLGVPPDQLAHLTQPFFRGEAARTAANGAGLGLAIVEKTIERMGGTFALHNANGGGLSAHIKLQRAAA